MKRIVCALGLLLAACAWATAQTNVFVSPNGRSSVNASSTITATNTFQSVFSAEGTDSARIGSGSAGGVLGTRYACTIQNNGTHNMYVYPGAIASATLTNSIILTPGNFFYCVTGVAVVSDPIAITGTSGDAFYAAYQ